MVYTFFDKKLSGSICPLSSASYCPLSSASHVNNEVKQNIKLADELHKPIIRNFEKRKVY